MTNKTFVRINKVVTADQAALVAAGINVAEVNGEVSQAIRGNWYGWETAVTVRDALLNNLVASSFDPEPVSISYLEHYGYDSAENVISGIVEIIPALLTKGVPEQATFNADSVWPWIAENVDIDPELYDVIASRYGPKHNTKTDSSKPGYLNPSHPRYSHKLAAAIAVWNAMEDESLLRGLSAKAAMTDWLTAHHKENGLELSVTGIKEVVVVANWKTTGGAPATPVK